MLQIKTIKKRLDYAAAFDEEVNAALSDGWQLTKREVLHPGQEYVYFSLYAELERVIITEDERDCTNCRYGAQNGGEPCDSCDENLNDKWEEAKR